MKHIELDAFTRFHFLSSLQFAPDGAHAAFTVSRCEPELRGYRHEIWLYTSATGETRQLTAASKDKGFCWADASTLLFPAARTEADRKAEEERHTVFYSIRIDGGEASPAFSVPLPSASARKISGGYLLRAVEGPEKEKKDDAPKADVEILEELPFWANGKGFASGRRARLYKYRPDGDTLGVLTPEKGEVGAFAISEDGQWLAYAVAVFDGVNPQKEALHLVDLSSGEEKTLLEGGVYSISHIAFVGDSLVLSMADWSRYGTSENDRLYRLPLSTGALETLAMPDRDISGNVATDCRLAGGTTFKADGGLLYFTMGADNEVYLYRMDAEGALTALSDGEGTLDCFDVHEGNILFIGMREMGLQELYRLAGGKAERLTGINASALNGYSVAIPQPLSFTNGDGVRIDGWVLLPPDYDPSKRYPAILDIHGGPKAVYGAAFYHEMQYWAGKGYVVCYCNPRGSGGRGDEFADLRGKYGTVDYDDLMAFADRALEQYPAIDSARVCVAGGSYGGFMVNWLIGHTDRFAAAASQRSIANWTSKCLTTDIGYYHNLSQIDGDPWRTPERFWDKSPLKYAPQAKTPTLFIHSDEDYRCWMAEGLQMFAALKMHGVPARLCLFEGENHELSRSGKPVNRIRRLSEITEWFDRYTKE